MTQKLLSQKYLVLNSGEQFKSVQFFWNTLY